MKRVESVEEKLIPKKLKLTLIIYNESKSLIHLNCEECE
jgi:hypothetical protein